MPGIKFCSISWIDSKPLPKIGYWHLTRAATSWPHRVVMGLVATSNPEPPVKIGNTESWRAGKQFRAFLACSAALESPTGKPADIVIDAGYTPPFDKSKLDVNKRALFPVADDPEFHTGEYSSVSGVVHGRLHECSTLGIPAGWKPVVSAFIKFRAGEHTDKLGTEEAKSPVHVPWVWCEFAILSSGAKLRMLGRGSTFPSHAWYVNGEQVAKCIQGPTAVSESEPAIATGQPADQVQSNADVDRSQGQVTAHAFTIQMGALMDCDISRFR